MNLSTDDSDDFEVSEAYDINYGPSEGEKDMSIEHSFAVKRDPKANNARRFQFLYRLGRFEDAKRYHRINIRTAEKAERRPRIQYAEMLLAVGDYKGLRAFVRHPDLSRREHRAFGQSHNGLLKAHMRLLSFFTHHAGTRFIEEGPALIIETVINLSFYDHNGRNKVCHCSKLLPNSLAQKF